MEVRVYTLEDLESHIQAIHSNGNTVIPLSPLRLQSYLKIPVPGKAIPYYLSSG